MKQPARSTLRAALAAIQRRQPQTLGTFALYDATEHLYRAAYPYRAADEHPDQDDDPRATNDPAAFLCAADLERGRPAILRPGHQSRCPMTRAHLTKDDLFTLRDALIHAERAHANDPAAVELRQKYQGLFRKIGAIIAASEQDGIR